MIHKVLIWLAVFSVAVTFAVTYDRERTTEVKTPAGNGCYFVEHVDNHERLHGSSKLYTAEGRLLMETVYSHGEWVSVSRYTPDGELFSHKKARD